MIMKAKKNQPKRQKHKKITHQIHEIVNYLPDLKHGSKCCPARADMALARADMVHKSPKL